MTDPTQQNHLLAVVARAKNLPDVERQALFRHEFPQDPDLQQQAERLFCLLNEATSAPGTAAGSVSLQGLPTIPGFELIELIGHGGMGSVYRARQFSPEREVAVKLVRADMISPEALDRMDREAQALARLNHPSIARVLASGRAATKGGPELSWLAMELIAGQRLDVHIPATRPAERELLDLFIQIGEAVQYAHQQGIIHRDLKPGNILVDESGRAHVLDFGVARFLDVDPAQASSVLETGEVVGTLSHMAPEQLDGRADTRSDVYAIGVMLYQALSGHLPLDLNDLSLIDSLNRLAHGQPRALRQRRGDLSPELETLVMQALARDPNDRYSSASQLLEDIRRYLDHRPLLARPPGRWRSGILFFRRHRLGVATAATVLLAVAIGAVVSVHFAWREAQARNEAEARADQLEVVNRFTRDMLLAADPEQTLGEAVTVLDIVSEAARLLPLEQDLSPAARVELQRTLGSVLLNLGRTSEGRVQLELAATTAGRHREISAADRQRTRMELARADLESGRIDKGLQALETIEGETLDWPLEQTLRYELANLIGRALLDSGRTTEADERITGRLDEARQHLGETHVLTLVLRNLSAIAAGRLGDLQREVDTQRDVLKLRQQHFGEEHPQTLAAMNNLAQALNGIGLAEEAESYAQHALAARERILGPEHPSTVVSRGNLAALYLQRGATEEAELPLRRVVAWNSARLGPLHPNTLTSQNLLAYLLEDQGQLAEAEAVYRQVLDAVDGSDDDGLRVQMLAASNNLAMLLLTRGDAAPAAKEFERLLAEAERLLGAEHPSLAIFQANYGWCLHHLDRSEEATQILELSLDRLRPVLGDAHPRINLTEERLGIVRASDHQ